MADGSDSYKRIYAAVRRIPCGRVATYGQVARIAGLPGHAREVGYALHSMTSDRPVPWHRVVNARGAISPRSELGCDLIQRQLLEREGVVFDCTDRLALSRFQWRDRHLPR